MILNRLSATPNKPALCAALIILVFLTSGCGATSSAPEEATALPVLSPTAAATATRPATTSTAEPSGPGEGTLPTRSTGEGGPTGPQIAGAPVVENLSRITARLVESAPDESRPDLVRLRVEVLSSAPVEGYVEYAAAAVGQQIDLLAPAQGLPQLAPGDRLRAEVRYVGDERGGAYYTSGIERVTPEQYFQGSLMDGIL